MEFLVLATLIGILPGAIAASKGYNFVVWWFFGAALFIVALPCALMLQPDQTNIDSDAALAAGGRKSPPLRRGHPGRGPGLPLLRSRRVARDRGLSDRPVSCDPRPTGRSRFVGVVAACNG